MARGAIVVLIAAALLGGLVSAAQAAKDDLVLVSRVSGATGAAGDDDSDSPSISADGRFVAFESDAGNLSDADNDTDQQIFVRDLQTNETTLVSRVSGAGAAGNGGSYDAAISADGRFVAFSSEADNLSGEDDDHYRNVFVRDLLTNVTTLVSRASGAAGAPADDSSFVPSISADGRLVAFGSEATNLSDADGDAVDDVFVRDLHANVTSLVSRASGAAGAAADSNSYEPALSLDGRLVAFSSNADNLSGADDDTVFDIFVRDLQTAATDLVSRASGAMGAAADGLSYSPSISADGRFVGFASYADNLSDADDDAVTDVFVRDLQTSVTTLVSRASGGAPGDGDSFDPSVSADGRSIAFASSADNVSDADDDSVADVFVRDLHAGMTMLVSRASGAAGSPGDGLSRSASISGDGRFVAFASDAESLSSEDGAFRDIFLRDVLGPPPAPSPPAPPPPPSAPPVSRDTIAPVVSGFAVLPGRFRVASAAAPRGSRFRFQLSESAAVRIVLARALPGRKVGRRCLKPTSKLRKRARCTRFLRVGTLTLPNRLAGLNSARFRGRIGARALRPGSYRATIAATDAANNRSFARRAGFRIVRR